MLCSEEKQKQEDQAKSTGDPPLGVIIHSSNVNDTQHAFMYNLREERKKKVVLFGVRGRKKERAQMGRRRH